MQPPQRCRELHPELDWMFFRGGTSLLGTDHTAVWAVRDEAAERLWSDFVSGDPATHYRALPPGHRLRMFVHYGPKRSALSLSISRMTHLIATEESMTYFMGWAVRPATRG